MQFRSTTETFYVREKVFELRIFHKFTFNITLNLKNSKIHYENILIKNPFVIILESKISKRLNRT